MIAASQINKLLRRAVGLSVVSKQQLNDLDLTVRDEAGFILDDFVLLGLWLVDVAKRALVDRGKVSIVERVFHQP